MYGPTGDYKGKIESNGLIYDGTGTYNGKIENGYCYDSTGSYKGKCPGVKKEWVAYIYFFK